MSYFTLKDGEKLYYEEKGNGPDTLIMIHGWTSSHEIFAQSAEALQKEARCIVYDQRGHGGSKDANSGSPTMETLAGDLHEPIQGLSLTNVTLLGWSMGACTILNYVSLYGCENIKQIILCDMTPKQLNDGEWKLGLNQGKYTKEDMEREEGKKFYYLYKKFVVQTIPKLRRIPGFLLKKPLKEALSKCDESVLRSLAASMKAQDNRPAVEQITVPVTYFYADPGSLFLPELANWYKAHVKTQYKAVAFPDSTHMLISENPEKFAQEVSLVLNS